jgi:hypothetical protein
MITEPVMNQSFARSTFLRLSLALVMLAALLPFSALAQTSLRYFSPTGHYLGGAFRYYWEQHGGLAIFGYPLTEEYVRKSDGRVVQYFERARFELHSQGNQPLVLLGQLGREVTGNRNFPGVAPFASTSTRAYFAQTGHSLGGAFKRFWDGNGGLAIFGYPTSEEFTEQTADGQLRTVQYFERNRFELHPDGVKLGLLGRQLVPQQLLAPWPPNVAPGAPLAEDGTPRPPAFPNAPQPQQPGTSSGQLFVRGNPGAVTTGQAFLVEGGGFVPGERVSIWLTAPDSGVLAVGDVNADSAGSINGARVQVVTAGFSAGTWHITAQGVRSGRAAVGEFRVNPILGNPAKLGIRIQEDLSVRGPGSIVPLAAPPGIAFTFNARGFDPNEEVGVWLTEPNGSGIEAVDIRTVRKDGNGGITVVFGTARQSEGIWLITAQGKQTRRAVTAPFKLTRDYLAPLGTPRPANVRGAASPVEGGQRTVFSLTATGFRPNETVQEWITSPDGVYYVAGTVQADRSGRVGYSQSLRVQFSASNPAGIYGYHFIGTASGTQADVYLTYTGAP